MYINVEAAISAHRAEQRLANLRATKYGPLFAEAQRKPAAKPRTGKSALIALGFNMVQRVSEATRGRSRPATQTGDVGCQAKTARYHA
jgi:hypothetical protein